jgi:glutathione S-transferase
LRREHVRSAFPPLGIIVWLTLYRNDAAEHATLIEDARSRAAQGLTFIEQALGDRAHLLGDKFSAADIMMGFTLVAARMFGLIDERLPRLQAYLRRLETRPAFQKAASVT